MSEWKVIPSDQFVRDMKWMGKRYPRETAQMIRNLDEYRAHLEDYGNPMRMVEYSYVHREYVGLPRHRTATARVRCSNLPTCFYCYVQAYELHLICAGDKQRQSKDNKYCKDYVSQF